MNRTVLKAGLFLCACNIVAMSHSGHVKALSLSTNEVSPAIAMASTSFPTSLNPDAAKTQSSEQSVQTEAPKPIEHIVQPGESLSTIATTYQTTWKRLYDKNTSLVSPDIITVNEHIVIPTTDEVLAEREIPVVVPTHVEAPQPTHAATGYTAPKTVTYRAGSSAGNTYSPGYCTWYAKSRRPDLPNNLGNAITWVSMAAAQGIPTGATPRVGAIGQSGDHVVYVEAVNGDGTVTISEMNWQGWGIVSSRTTSAGAFSYIY